MIHLFIVRYSVFEEATTEYEVSVIDDLMNRCGKLPDLRTDHGRNSKHILMK